jgi:hypothetical protein
MKRLLLISILIFSWIATFAQYSVEAKIDSMEMFIGQQVHVTVSVAAPANARVTFPTFKPEQQITPGIEILADSTLEEQTLSDGQTMFAHIYTLTSFDGKLYYIPPFSVRLNGKVYKSKSLALKVMEVEVDTTKAEQFFGPKGVQDNPFLWSDWSGIFCLSILVLLLAIIGYYLYLRMRDNKPIITHIKIVKRLLPHQKALKEIERIKEEKMVISENPKEYYTKLTDTLRKYIEERYGFSAMEMTSAEIIERLMSSQNQEAIDELRTLFQTADLVKFAKYSTLINENDMNLVNAVAFIDHTKQENLPTEEKVKPELTADQVRSAKTRKVLQTVIGIITITSVALLTYVVYMVYQLLN